MDTEDDGPERGEPQAGGLGGRGTESRMLVDDVSNGVPGAVDSLLQKHLPGLQRFLSARAGALVGARESGADLAQSVCREVLQRLEVGNFEYRGEAQFKQWLYQAALFKIQDRRKYWLADKRAAGREVPMAGVGPETSAGVAPGVAAAQDWATPSQDAALNEELEAIRRAFDQLPARYAAVLKAVHFEGRSHREVAEELGTTEANSRMLLSRALARMAKLRASEGFGEG